MTDRSGGGRSRRGRLVVITVATALVAASGCGARWDDEQRAAVIAAHRGVGDGGTGTAGADQVAAGTGPAGTAPTGNGRSTGAAAASAGGSATGASPEAAAADRPCAAPSDAPGVTPEQITLGSISTLSGPVPGLGASSLAAVRAYVEYRNASGGVCGRELVLKTVDDGMDNGRYRAALDGLSSEVIGIAGGVAGGDAGGVDVAEAKQVPVVSTPISTSFQNVSTVFDINPPFADVNAVIAKYRYLHDQGVQKAALVYISADQTREEVRDKQKPQILAAGIQVVHEQELPLSTLSFDSAARAVANSGADYLLFVSDAGQSASMAKSMRDTGYTMKFEEYLTAYGSNYLELAGAAAEGTSSWIRSLPNEEPGTNGEHDAFLAWMGQTAPDVKPDTFSADAWAATKALVDGLEALPGPITREALIGQLRSVTDFDAGGLIGPILLGPKLNKGCFIAMKVVSGAWTRITPDRGFLC